MLDRLSLPIIFAHRGASAYAPENTLAAFQLALDQGADGIELDAKLSADGSVVVIHDQTVDRTTPGFGQVGDLTLNELRTLDAGSHFDISFQGEKIPTLEEVFDNLGGKIFINIELTNYASPNDSLPSQVARLVRRYQLEGWVLFSSFNPFALRRIHHLVPEAPIGLLALPSIRGAWARSRFGQLLISYQALHPEKGDLTPSLVHRIHNAGCRVFVYTVNDPDEMKRLFSFQVDGIFTDDPLLARAVSRTIGQTNQSRTIAHEL